MLSSERAQQDRFDSPRGCLRRLYKEKMAFKLKPKGQVVTTKVKSARDYQEKKLESVGLMKEDLDVFKKLKEG